MDRHGTIRIQPEALGVRRRGGLAIATLCSILCLHSD